MSEYYDPSLSSGATATEAAAAGVKSDTAAKRNQRNESYRGQAEEGAKRREERGQPSRAQCVQSFGVQCEFGLTAN